MTKLLCLLLIAVLAAQICATPADKEDPAKKEAEAAKKEAEGDKDKVAKALKDGEKEAEKDSKDVLGKGEKDAEDCKDDVEKAVKPEHHKHHHKGIVATVAKTIQAFGDSFLGFFE